MDTVDELENFSQIGALLSSVTDIEGDYRILFPDLPQNVN